MRRSVRGSTAVRRGGGDGARGPERGRARVRSARQHVPCAAPLARPPNPPFPPPTLSQPPGEAPGFGLRFSLGTATLSRAVGPKPSLAPSQSPVARSRGLVGWAQPHGLVTAGMCCAWWTRTAAPPQPRPQRRSRRRTCAARSAEAVAGGMRAWRRTRWSGSQRRRGWRGLCKVSRYAFDGCAEGEGRWISGRRPCKLHGFPVVYYCSEY